MYQENKNTDGKVVSVTIKYTPEQIAEEVKRITALRGQTAITKDGQDLSSPLTFTGDEEYMQDNLLSPACALVWPMFARLTANADSDLSLLNGTVSMIIYPDVASSAYSLNYLNIIDKQTLHCLITSCVAEWYKCVGRPDWEQEYRQMFSGMIAVLQEYLSRIKKRKEQSILLK